MSRPVNPCPECAGVTAHDMDCTRRDELEATLELEELRRLVDRARARADDAIGRIPRGIRGRVVAVGVRGELEELHAALVDELTALRSLSR